MAKLHELLAVEGSLENQTKKVVSELANTFEKKRHLFEEKRTTFISSTEGAPAVVELQSDIQTTVDKELKWVSQHVIKSLDASYQVAEANTAARADVLLEDGTPLLRDMPATALLELEKRVAELHTLVVAIPTLDPAKGFVADVNRGCFVAREVVKTRTKKTPKVLVKYEATDKHPAQTEVYQEDVPIGKIQEQEWSGLVTPLRKSELIDKVEKLARAVRQARSRANEVPVDASKTIGKVLVDFVLN